MPHINTTDNQKEQPHSTRVATLVWLCLFFVISILFTAVCTAWSVRCALTGGPWLSEDQAQIIFKLSDIPGTVRLALQELKSTFGFTPARLLIRNTNSKSQLRLFPAPEDSGYLLLSGLSPNKKFANVRLIRVSDGKTIFTWNPDWHRIYSKISDKAFAPKGSPAEATAVHPILLNNGDIVFNTGNSLVKLTPCSQNPVWVIDQTFHHSNEVDSDGSTWTPSISTDGFRNYPWLQQRVRDDSLAHVSKTGTIIRNISFAQVLIANGFQAFLIGTSGFRLNTDPTHINQIQVAHTDSHFWKKGDLLISARHLSTIFLYRPSTNMIVWHKTGPWMNQHSADFVGDHEISIFSNNVISAPASDHSFLSKSDINKVFLYDFKTGTASEPFAKALSEFRPRTITEGRARILPDGGLFIEETESGRHLRFTKNRLLWSRFNDYDKKSIGITAWSRYLTSDEVKSSLKSLSAKKCYAE